MVRPEFKEIRAFRVKPESKEIPGLVSRAQQAFKV
jgi:hypothetical protein